MTPTDSSCSLTESSIIRAIGPDLHGKETEIEAELGGETVRLMIVRAKMLGRDFKALSGYQTIVEIAKGFMIHPLLPGKISIQPFPFDSEVCEKLIHSMSFFARECNLDVVRAFDYGIPWKIMWVRKDSYSQLLVDYMVTEQMGSNALISYLDEDGLKRVEWFPKEFFDDTSANSN